MLNQNFSTSTTSNFQQVIAFLQPPYEHSNNCLKVKQDIAELCQKKNLNLITAIDFKDSCDQQALNRLAELVKHYASNLPIIIMINEEMVATPANIPFWSATGTLARMKLITVIAYDYDYIKHGDIFLDDSYLRELDLLGVATNYFDQHFLSSQNKANKTYIGDILITFKLKDTSPSFRKISKNFTIKLKQYFINFKTKRHKKENIKELEQRIKEKLAALEKM